MMNINHSARAQPQSDSGQGPETKKNDGIKNFFKTLFSRPSSSGKSTDGVKDSLSNKLSGLNKAGDQAKEAVIKNNNGASIFHITQDNVLPKNWHGVPPLIDSPVPFDLPPPIPEIASKNNGAPKPPISQNNTSSKDDTSPKMPNYGPPALDLNSDKKVSNHDLLNSLIDGLASDLVKTSGGYQGKTEQDKANEDTLKKFTSTLTMLFSEKGIDTADHKKSSIKFKKTNPNFTYEKPDAEFFKKLKIAYDNLPPSHKLAFNSIAQKLGLDTSFLLNNEEKVEILSEIKEKPQMAEPSADDVEFTKLVILNRNEIAENNKIHERTQQKISDVSNLKNTQTRPDPGFDEIEKLLSELANDELEEELKDFDPGSP